MRIYNNISAMTAYRSMTNTNNAISKNMERLSTGLRINSAADDATGLVISEQMKSQISGFNQAIKNAQQGKSMLQTAEGAMGQQGELLARIRELVISANSGNMTPENLQTIQNEIEELTGQIDDIAKSTEYNGKKLLDGSLGSKLVVDSGSTALAVGGVSSAKITGKAVSGDLTINTSGNYLKLTNADGTKMQSVDLGATSYNGTVNFDAFGVSLTLNIGNITDLSGKTLDLQNTTGAGVDFQVGANAGAGQSLNVQIGDKTAAGLGIAIGNINVVNNTFSGNLALVDAAITNITTSRATLGSRINRFDASINNLQVSKENLQSSQSLIADLDMAEEMVQLTRNQVLSQASTAMLAQANQRPQAILQLLNG